MNKRLVVLALLSACGVEDPNDLASATQALEGGQPTNARNAVVKFLPANGGLCTATMTSSTTFLTAANCIGFAPMQAGGTIMPLSGAQNLVKQTFSQGGQTGNDDLAVGVLVEAIPDIDAAVISTREPKNEQLTAIGYGCTSMDCDASESQRTFVSYDYFGQSTQLYEPGDWGGPTFLGALNDNGAIVRVASTRHDRLYPTANFNDVGADPVAYKAQLDGLRTTLTNTGVSYRSHVQSLGWTTAVQNGAVSGTTQNLRLEGLQVWTQNPNEHVCYSARVQNAWLQGCDGALAGTVGKSLPIGAITIDRRVGSVQWPLRYRVFSANVGWGPWVSNNAIAGTQVDNVEAIQIEFQTKIVIPPGCCTGIN